jgi:hypothetical protein
VDSLDLNWLEELLWSKALVVIEVIKKGLSAAGSSDAESTH